MMLALLSEETKKLKKNKKKSIVSAPILKRPMGSIFYMDSAVSMTESIGDLQKQVLDSKDINEFVKNIISDYDLRYKNRRAAEFLVKIKSIDFIDSIKPDQKIHKETLDAWIDIIKEGKRPFIIVRTNNEIDGHHKLEAYRTLGFNKVPVLFEKDLIDFYNKNKVQNLNESTIKPIVKKFNHLKWPLKDIQKQFLDDFINIPDEYLNENDFEYASKLTGIPLSSIKSIKNTYSDKKTLEQEYLEKKKISSQLGMGGHDLDQDTISTANKDFATPHDLPKDKEGRQWSLNPNPNFRSQTPGETMYKAKHGNTGGLYKKTERELPAYMYEWLMYFVEGNSKIKITESKLMNDFHSNKFDKYKYILFSFDVTIKESNAHAYDNMSTDSKLKEISDFRDKVLEFNEMFGTNFIICNQYTGNDGFLKVFLENNQTTDGVNVYNKEMIDMNDTDISKATRLGFYDQFTTSQTHKFGNDDQFTSARSITS